MQTIPQLLDSLTVFRDIRQTVPVMCLRDLCASIKAADYDDAVNDYCAMTSELLGNYRRVTGDVWKDFLFSMLLEAPNRYSLTAAAGRNDPALKLAVTMDLRSIQQLFTLTCEEISKKIMSFNPQNSPNLRKAKPNVNREENIKNMAFYAWSGKMSASAAPAPRPVKNFVQAEIDLGVASQNAFELPSWRYDEPAVHYPPYAADFGLAKIYRQFLAELDWGVLAQALFDFHAQCGTGEFLHYRSFLYDERGIKGIDVPPCVPYESFLMLDTQLTTLNTNLQSFAEGNECKNILLYGSGTGKTSSICSVCDKIRDLRLVYLNCRDFESYSNAIASLSHQPLKFVALLDDVTLREFEYRRLKASLGHVEAPNVVLVATSHYRLPDKALFGLQIEFAPLAFDDFLQLTLTLVEDPDIDLEEVKQVCQTWQSDKNDLTVRAAINIAKMI